MVLLQGGNSKEKIYEELVIFMNSPEVAEHFVLWLFEEIERLISVRVAVPVSIPESLVMVPNMPNMTEAQTQPETQNQVVEDVQMGSGSRVHSTRNFSKALESVKSNVNNPVRRTFSTTEPSTTSESRDYNHPNPRRSPQRQSNRRIVRSVTEQDGKVQKIKLSVDFDRDEGRGRGPAGRKPFKKIQVNPENDLNGKEDNESGPPTIRVKCPYWPNCRAGDSCPNVHPSETCRNFPNCQFGDACTFLHPSIPCKFQEKCQNPLCNYQHRPMAMAAMMGAVNPGTSTILCKFYPRCVNINCPYLHPVKVQCRYGIECSRPDCPFEHPSGRKGAHLKSVVFAPCKYGKQCARADCPYQHSEEAVGTEIINNNNTLNNTDNNTLNMNPVEPTPMMQ